MGEGAETPASMASRRGIGVRHRRYRQPRRTGGFGATRHGCTAVPSPRDRARRAARPEEVARFSRLCGRFGAVQARVFRPGARRPVGGGSPARVRLPLAAGRRRLASQLVGCAGRGARPAARHCRRRTADHRRACSLRSRHSRSERRRRPRASFRAGSSVRSIAEMVAPGMLADLVLLDRALVTGSRAKSARAQHPSSQGPDLVMVERSFEAAAPTASITGS
jgi:hypothetical protein